ncbi:MAG: hypothetical protein AABY22_13220 [Nanoarchaeota archaeon]
MKKQEKLDLNKQVRKLQDKAFKMAKEYGEVDENSQTIKSPGKFEAEWYPVVYFYDQSMNGFSNPREGYDEIELTKTEKLAFNSRKKYARLYFSDSGFVHLSI